MAETIRQCTAADLPGLMARFATLYRHNPRMTEADHLAWQYRDNPHWRGDDYALLLLEEAGTGTGPQLTGFLGLVPVALRLPQRRVTGCWLQHWHSLAGGLGGLRLLLAAQQRWDHLLLAAFSDSARGVYQALRVPMIERIPRYLAIVDPEAARHALNLPGDDPRSGAIASAAARLRHGLPSPLVLAPVARFAADLPDPLAPWPGIDHYAVRDAAWLNWRYVGVPHHPYQLVQDPHGGFVVWREEGVLDRPPARVARVVEWTVAPPYTAAATAALLERWGAAGVALADFSVTAAPMGAALANAGWLAEADSPRPLPNLFRPLHSAPGPRLGLDLPPHRSDRQIPFGRWYVTRGDSDMDRVKL